MSQIGRFISGTGAAPIETLTGNVGGPVGPNGSGNIDILGGNDITVTGNPGTNTLTIDLDASIADTYVTDSGNAVPAAGILNVVSGSTAISTAGAGNTVTISSTGISVLAYRTVNTTPYVVAASDGFLGVDSSGGIITIQLPDAPVTGRVIIIKDKTGSANSNAITVTTVSGIVTIDGSTSYTMNTQYANIQVIFDGTAYQIF